MIRRLLVAALCAGAVSVTVAVPASAGSTTTLSLDLSPSHPRVGSNIVASGRLTSSSPVAAGEGVTLTKTAGGNSGPVVCQENGLAFAPIDPSTGNYICTDSQPAAWGDVTYQASYSGDSANSASQSPAKSVHVHRRAADLRLIVDNVHATTGDRIHIKARFASTSDQPEHVTLYVKPYGHPRRQAKSGDANPQTQTSPLTADVTVHRRTTVVAVFAGDNTFAPKTSRRLVHVRAIVGESLRRNYGRQGDVRLYHRGVNPALVVKLLPAHKGSCIHFRAQRHYAGHWHTTAVSHCVRTDGHGLALGVFRGDHVVGKLYRVRAEWRGSRAVEARNGAWLRLRFSD